MVFQRGLYVQFAFVFLDSVTSQIIQYSLICPDIFKLLEMQQSSGSSPHCQWTAEDIGIVALMYQCSHTSTVNMQATLNTFMPSTYTSVFYWWKLSGWFILTSHTIIFYIIWLKHLIIIIIAIIIIIIIIWNTFIVKIQGTMFVRDQTCNVDLSSSTYCSDDIKPFVTDIFCLNLQCS